MAFFELWPPRSDIKFSPGGPFPQPGAMSNILIPELRLGILEAETVALSAQPDSGKLIVKPVNPGSVKVERILDPSPHVTVYRVTALAAGTSSVEARPALSGTPSVTVNGSLATLSVAVVDKKTVTTSADFVTGFKEGFSASAGKAGEIVLVKISKEPQAFVQAVQAGCARGLLEGVVSLGKSVFAVLKLGVGLSPAGMIVNTARYVFDQTFRDEIDKHAAEAMKLAETMTALATDMALHKNQFVGIFKVNGKMIGRIVGEEIGREMVAEVTKKSAAAIGDWVGFIIGRVMFEVIFIIGTEGIGMAAGAAKVTGEGAGLAARLMPKLRALLAPLRELEAFVKGRLGIKATAEAVEAIKVYINLNPRALAEEVALGRWLDEMAQSGRLGEAGRVRGMPEGVTGGPDYHFVPKGQDAANPAIPGQRWDGVIAESNNINNIISNAIGSKAGRQADIVVIEIGTKGNSAAITDSAVTAWEAQRDVAPMSPSLKRLLVVRNTGGVRTIVHDMRIR